MDKNIELIIQKPNYSKSILLGILILVTGVIIGISSTIIFYELQPSRQKRHEIPSKKMLTRMTKQLNLTPEQTKKIEPVLIEHMRNLIRIRLQARPQVRRELKSMHEEIKKLLNEDQAEIWDSKFKRLNQRLRPPPGRNRRLQRRPPMPTEDPNTDHI